MKYIGIYLEEEKNTEGKILIVKLFFKFSLIANYENYIINLQVCNIKMLSGIKKIYVYKYILFRFTLKFDSTLY